MRHLSELSPTEATAKIICEIANSVDTMISFEYDVPEFHDDLKLSVLDLKVYLDSKNKVIHEFYEKPSKNSRVILASSALSWQQKRTIHTQEALRRLRNTSLSLGENVQNDILSTYMLKLKESGYSAQFRAEIILSSKKAYKFMVGNHNRGK